jgi:hypothetical protein
VLASSDIGRAWSINVAAARKFNENYDPVKCYQWMRSDWSRSRAELARKPENRDYSRQMRFICELPV